MLARKDSRYEAGLEVVTNRQGRWMGIRSYVAVKAVFGEFGQRTVVLITAQRL